MTKYFLIAIFSLFILGPGLQSCNKSTCPTYASSGGPSKAVKKKIKKSRAAYSKQDKKARQKKGKAISGLDE